jgi:hypothetical protein
LEKSRWPQASLRFNTRLNRIEAIAPPGRWVQQSAGQRDLTLHKQYPTPTRPADELGNNVRWSLRLGGFISQRSMLAPDEPLQVTAEYELGLVRQIVEGDRQVDHAVSIPSGLSSFSTSFLQRLC